MRDFRRILSARLSGFCPRRPTLSCLLSELSARMGAMSGKVRSPSFPFINLREALARAKVLYQAERRNAAPLAAVAHHWGYSPNSSAANRTVAALVALGLLEVTSRKARLTDRAVRILLDEREPSPERERLIREAALLPNLHRKLWDKYRGELPSDATLRLHLITEESFNEGSVGDFLRVLRETLELARLVPVASRIEAAPSPSVAREPSSPTPRSQTSEVDTAVFPLLDGNTVEFRIRRLISPDEAEDVRKVFEIWLRKIVER